MHQGRDKFGSQGVEIMQRCRAPVKTPRPENLGLLAPGLCTTGLLFVSYIYIYIYVCVFTHIYIYIYIYLYIHMSAMCTKSLAAPPSAGTESALRYFGNSYVCMYVCMYVCIHMYIHVYVYMYIYIYTHVC